MKGPRFGAFFLLGVLAWRILGPSGPFYFLPCPTYYRRPKAPTIGPHCASWHAVNLQRLPNPPRIGAAAPGLTRPACYRPAGPGLPSLGAGCLPDGAKTAARARKSKVSARILDAWDTHTKKHGFLPYYRSEARRVG